MEYFRESIRHGVPFNMLVSATAGLLAGSVPRQPPGGGIGRPVSRRSGVRGNEFTASAEKVFPKGGRCVQPSAKRKGTDWPKTVEKITGLC